MMMGHGRGKQSQDISLLLLLSSNPLQGQWFLYIHPYPIRLSPFIIVTDHFYALWHISFQSASL